VNLSDEERQLQGKSTVHRQIAGYDETNKHECIYVGLSAMVELTPCLVGMEACPTSNYWGRELQKHGHQVRLMAPRFVRPYVKANKNDTADAEAICEAVRLWLPRT
jgi:transposase